MTADGAVVTGRARPFVVYADRFEDNVGGTIALHRLCDVLNREGATAYLWDARRPVVDPAHALASRWAVASYRLGRRASRYRTGPGFVTPLAGPEHVPGAIVVYPEVVEGNPLGARHVVRWLLHRPGFHTGKAHFTPGDRYFFFQKAFDDPGLHIDPSNLLRVLFVRDDIYRQVNFGRREGSCYILRKGKGRPIVHDLDGSVLVDDLPHARLAEVFNRVERCISYDPYTMYSIYAALCGAVSIVVPEAGVSKEQWYPDPADRFGLAYGFDDVDHALATRHLLLPRLKAQESEANRSVRAFVEKCRTYFP